MWFSSLNGGAAQLPIFSFKFNFIVINVKGLLNWKRIYNVQNKS
jgi:hypothetical protein